MKGLVPSSLLLFALTLIGCGILSKPEKPRITISKITLLNLEVKDLSENFHTLSSKKDEIIFFAYHFKNDNILIDSFSKSNLSFTETTTHQELDFIFPINEFEPGKIVFILIEQDTKRSKKELEDLLQSNFHQLNGIQSQKESLQLLLGDDDLLGLKVWDLEKLSVSDNSKVRFSGVHLFDEYEYILHGKLE